MMYIICIFYNISFVSLYVLLLSHPMRVRGLKFIIVQFMKFSFESRTPCGCVD